MEACVCKHEKNAICRAEAFFASSTKSPLGFAPESSLCRCLEEMFSASTLVLDRYESDLIPPSNIV